jgi:hypothetical protein
MKFNPKFSSYRSRLATLAIVFGTVGAVLVFSGHDSCHRGRDRLVIAGILLLSAAVPESPAKRVQPEKYDLTGSRP